MSRRGVFLGGLAVAFFTGRAARAAPSGSAAVELTWDAPAGCASAPEVRAAVGRLVGASATARSSLDVHGRVREESGRFLVILDVGRGDERSRRSIIAPSCELATDAAVVVIAMLVPAGAPAPRAVAPAPPSDALPPAPDATNALRRSGSGSGALLTQECFARWRRGSSAPWRGELLDAMACAPRSAGAQRRSVPSISGT